MLTSCVGEIRIASDDDVSNAGRRGKAVQPAAIVQPFRRVRISQKDGIVEIEEQAADPTTEGVQLPRGKEPSLQDDDVGGAQVEAKPQPSPEVGRKGTQFEVMAGGVK